jgi:hypothetical protein
MGGVLHLVRFSDYSLNIAETTGISRMALNLLPSKGNHCNQLSRLVTLGITAHRLCWIYE